MESVFLSYRREDSAGHAGRLAEHLGAVLGPEHVFMDVQDIAPGRDFAEAIERTVSACQALLVVIGPRWADSLKQRAGENDFVLHEVSAALRRNVTVIPVLVGGATMPSPAELPKDIASLSRRQAVQIRDTSFDEDTKRLGQTLCQLLGSASIAPRRSSPRLWILLAAALAIASVGIFAWKRSSAIDINGVWIAEMQKANQKPFRVRLDLVGLAGDLTGAVSYPTGDAPIQEGKIESNQLVFSTVHRPDFASEAATIRWRGIFDGNEIRFSAADDNGVARGLARRVR